MIVDAFIFFNENDILDIRFEELYPVVDKFIVVQADVTFRGLPKPDYFDYERHAQYMDKVDVFTIPLSGGSHWDREKWQRNGLGYFLSQYPHDSIVIISDADEIPRRSAIANLDYTGPVRLGAKKFMYSLNALTQEESYAIKVTTIENVVNHGAEYERREGDFTAIEDAGWEFSSFGTPEMVRTKLQSYSHSELDIPEFTDLERIEQRMKNREDVAGRPWPLRVVPIDDTWPEAVKNNPEKWSEYVWV